MATNGVATKRKRTNDGDDGEGGIDDADGSDGVAGCVDGDVGAGDVEKRQRQQEQLGSNYFPPVENSPPVEAPSVEESLLEEVETMNDDEFTHFQRNGNNNSKVT